MSTTLLSAENTFTDSVISTVSAANDRDIAISITGTFIARVTVQRSLDGGTTWGDLPVSFNAPREYNVTPNRTVLYRVGIKTGDYTSGTVKVIILV